MKPWSPKRLLCCGNKQRREDDDCAWMEPIPPPKRSSRTRRVLKNRSSRNNSGKRADKSRWVDHRLIPDDIASVNSTVGETSSDSEDSGGQEGGGGGKKSHYGLDERIAAMSIEDSFHCFDGAEEKKDDGEEEYESQSENYGTKHHNYRRETVEPWSLFADGRGNLVPNLVPSQKYVSGIEWEDENAMISERVRAWRLKNELFLQQEILANPREIIV